MERKAHQLAKKFKSELIDFIKYEVGLISNILKHDEDEEGVFVDGDELAWKPTIDVSVDNSYLDVYDDVTERREITKVSCGEGKPFINTEEGDEIYLENLSCDDLITIADAVEDTYSNISHK